MTHQLRQAGKVRLEHLEHRRRVERRGRVVKRIEEHAAAGDRQRLLLPVYASDAERPPGEELGREVAERCDHFRLDQLDLAKEVRLARLDLVLLRVAVAGWAALEDVRDIDVLAPEVDAGEQPLEQLPRLADEGDALLVLVEAGRLADEHQVGVRVARAEDDLRPSLREPAARAAGSRYSVRLERLDPRDRHRTHGHESTRHAPRPRSAPASTVTTPLAAAPFSSTTVACWIRWRSTLIRASSSPCSFFAAWYSKFSERSPCARAVAIACTTSLRFGP